MATASQVLWYRFAGVFTPQYPISQFLGWLILLLGLGIAHSFFAKLTVRQADTIKLVGSCALTAHSFYACFQFNLYTSELLASIVLILIVFHVLKFSNSIGAYCSFVFLCLLPFLQYHNGHISNHLALLLWFSVTVASAAAAFTRISTEEKLANSLNFNSRILDSLSEGLVVHDKEFRIIQMNPAALRMLDVKSKEEIGTANQDNAVWDLFYEDGTALPREKLPNHLAYITGQQMLNQTIMIRSRRNQEYKILTVSAVPVFLDDSDAPSKILVTMQDITQFRKREMELKQNEAALVHAGKLTALGEMAGGIAHEINNPLAIIAGKVGLLKKRASMTDKIESSVVMESLNKVEITVKRISKIIASMRAFTRQDTESPFEVVEIKVLIEEIMELCKETFARDRIDVQIEAPVGLHTNCNPIQIGQVLMNLMQNSRDAIRDQSEKWIRLDCIENGELIEIRCTDSGPRIPDAVAAKIMQPFFTTKEVGKGTGLGLSISKGIIDKHGGTFTLNRSHSNTQFCLTLPKKAQSMTA